MGALIGDVLFTKTQQRVLGLLFGKPDQRFYTNEILRWAAMGRGSVRRELERLVEAGVVGRECEGNQQYYQANADCPVFAELVSLVKKTFGLCDVVAEALSPLMPEVELAFIYGSIAKGGEDKTSDVDLLLVGEGLEYATVMDLLLPVEQTLGRPINPSLYTPRDFKTKLAEGQSFVTRIVEQDKLMIKGSVDDAREFTKN